MSVSDFLRNKLLLLGVILITSISSHAQAQVPNRSNSNGSLERSLGTRPRMKVIEIAPVEKKSQNFFTIVGAVERSGVFYSSNFRIPLEQLLTAAGGLAGVDKSSIRIVRNGQAGLQLYYLQDQELTQEIQAGDVIIVVPSRDQSFIESAEKQFIPVACLGISERPVVLPLLVTIRSVDQLLQDLGQSQSIKSSLRVLDPLGDSKTDRLRPGTVLFFDSATVDRNSLATVKEFPPAVSLEDAIAESSETSGPSTLQQDLVDNHSPETNSGITIQPFNDSFQDGNSFSTRSENASETGATQPPPLLMNPQKSVITVEEPATALAVEESKALPDISSPDSGRENYSNGIAQINGTPIVDLLPEDDAIETSLDATIITQNAKTDQQQFAPPPPFESRVMRKFDESPVSSPSSKLSKIDSNQSKEIVASTVEKIELRESHSTNKSGLPSADSRSQLIPIILGLGGIAAACLLFSILWSRSERHQLRKENETFTKSKHTDNETLTNKSKKNADQLSQVLDSEISMIEEAVLLPQEIVFHGEPIGQRRIIIHPREEKLRGPHFNSQRNQNKKQASSRESVSAVEQKKTDRVMPPVLHQSTEDVKDQKHDVVQVPRDGSNDPIMSNQEIVRPVNVSATSNSRVDVVVPIETEIEESGNGPLERALRILAREKNV